MPYSPTFNQSLNDIDPKVYSIIKNEEERQKNWITLIPSENFTSKAVNQAVGSILTNKYTEGYPGFRYYGGTENFDALETLCQQRALEAFKLDKNRWGVLVQALSGSPANLVIYMGLLENNDTILYLDLCHGGHLSHGHQTPIKKLTVTSRIFNCVPYHVNLKTGVIDYEEIQLLADTHKPKMIICGTSCYSQLIDYKKFREIADSCNAKLHCDIAHISGLIAAGVIPSPFEYADTVMTTTHKSLRGPRGALIFCRLGEDEAKLKTALFPGLQGGPHNHTIAGIAVALLQAQTPEFVQYQKNVLENCKALASSLKENGVEIFSGKAENHLLVIDLRPKKINGSKVDKVCEACFIAGNKNTLPTDTSPFNPNGFRIGTPAMTTRGVDAEGFKKIGVFLARAIEIAQKIQSKSGPKLVDFVQVMRTECLEEMAELREDVLKFTKDFPAIGNHL